VASPGRVQSVSYIALTFRTMNVLLNAQEVAAMLGVPASWVYSQTRAGRIPTVKLGRYYRYRREAIEAWISEREAVAAA